MNIRYRVRRLSNEQLIEAVHRASRSTNEHTAVLLAHLGEMDRRGLYLRKAMPSMFQYAVDVLNFSESQAYMRIHAARTALRFPLILGLVAEGAVHLTAIRLVSPHLTEENYRELLEAVSRKSKREIQLELAQRFPLPDAPQVLRKLPEPVREPAVQPGSTPPMETQSEAQAEPANGSSEAATEPFAGALPQEIPVTKTAPLSATRYKLQVTLSEDTERKLREAQQLLRHRIPDGDLSKVLDAAVDALLKEAHKQQYGVTNKPRVSKKTKKKSKSSRTRHIPHAVRREVLKRDGLQCAFTSDEGKRCPETGFLQLHHENAFAKGGAHSAGNVRVFCRAHNMFEAEKDYGKERMRVYRREASGARKGTVREKSIVYRFGETDSAVSGHSSILARQLLNEFGEELCA